MQLWLYFSLRQCMQIFNTICKFALDQLLRILVGPEDDRLGLTARVLRILDRLFDDVMIR